MKKWCKDRKNKWNMQKNSSIAGLFENKEARIVTMLLRGRDNKNDARMVSSRHLNEAVASMLYN